MLKRPRYRLAAILLATTALVAACGDDDEDVSATPGDQEPASSSTTAPAGETINVVGVDYAFEGLPAEISAGTKVNFTNGTKANEVHEFVAIRIPDTETRAVSELVKLPEEEIDAIFGSGPPAAVLIAPPGGAPMIPAVVTAPSRSRGGTPSSASSRPAQRPRPTWPPWRRRRAGQSTCPAVPRTPRMACSPRSR